MTFGEHILTHPGDILINGVPYQLDVNPRSNPPNQLAWEEEPVLDGTPPAPGPGLKHTPIPNAQYAWLSEQVLDSFHLGMGDALNYDEHTYHYAQDVDAGEPNVVTLGPLRTQLTITVTAGGDPVGYFELGGRLYLLWSRFIRELGTLSGTPTDTADIDLGASQHVSDAKIFRNAAVVALGSGAVFRSRASGAAPGTYTSADSGLTADYFTVTEEFLYRVDSDNSNSRVGSCATSDSPLTAANWSAEIDIGGGSAASFTDLETFGYQVLVGREDGVFRTNRLGFAPNLLDEFKGMEDTANARQMKKAFGNMYIPHLRGMFRYDGRGPMQLVGLEKLYSHNHSNLGPVAGVYQATATDGQWLYVALWNGTDTYIMKYREMTVGDELRGVWHPYAYWSANQVTALHVTGLSGTNSSLWASSTTNELISRWFLPAAARSQVGDSGYTYATSGTIWLPRLYMGSRENTKYFTEVDIEADNLSATETLTFGYRTTVNFPWSASSPSFTDLAALTATGTQTIGASGRFIEPRIAFARGGTTTETPAMRRVTIKAIQVAPWRNHYKCRVIVSPDDLYLQGGETVGAIDDQTPETTLDALRALESSASTITVIDPRGESHTVLLVDRVEVTAIAVEGHVEPRAVATLHFVEV